MDTHKKFTIYGPKESLSLLGSTLKNETKPHYFFEYNNSSSEDEIYFALYEEHQKLTNACITLNLIIKVSQDVTNIDYIITGGKMGFRGSSYSSDTIEPLIQEVVYNFLIDFSRRLGLTIQETIPSTPE